MVLCFTWYSFVHCASSSPIEESVVCSSSLSESWTRTEFCWSIRSHDTVASSFDSMSTWSGDSFSYSTPVMQTTLSSPHKGAVKLVALSVLQTSVIPHCRCISTVVFALTSVMELSSSCSKTWQLDSELTLVSSLFAASSYLWILTVFSAEMSFLL